MSQGGGSKKALFSWYLFDWASSPFPVIIVTFVFSAYFTQGVAENPETGASLWGLITGLAGIGIAALAPITGGVADYTGRSKIWLAGLTGMVAVGCFLLWFATPHGVENGLFLDPIIVVAIGITLSMVGFETGMVFYNTLLSNVATPDKLGRTSGVGWGIGYFGGLVALVAVLFLFVQVEQPPFGLEKDTAEHVRITPILVGVWFLLFAIPLFIFVPDQPGKEPVPLRIAIQKGVRDLVQTLLKIREMPDLFWFLLARMTYMDGLNSLFALGGVYAAAVFDMSLAEVIQFGIALNIVAGIGCFIMGWLDDKLGPLMVIRVSLLIMLVVSVPMILTDNETVFWGLGMVLGFFMGPVQASSRSYMSRMAPPEHRAEFFGLYAFSGRITSFVGPLLFAWVVAATASHRWGMVVCIVLVAGGLALTLKVRKLIP